MCKCYFMNQDSKNKWAILIRLHWDVCREYTVIYSNTTLFVFNVPPFQLNIHILWNICMPDTFINNYFVFDLIESTIYQYKSQVSMKLFQTRNEHGAPIILILGYRKATEIKGLHKGHDHIPIQINQDNRNHKTQETSCARAHKNQNFHQKF